MILFVLVLLLVALFFILLLNMKFLSQVDETNRIPHTVLGARAYRRYNFAIHANNNNMNLPSRIKGLESRVISTIPQFVFKEEEQREGQWHGLECVICLSSFENGQVGRMLPVCNHAFHVECIDMWLYTHTTCPICRASAVQVSSPPEDHEVRRQEPSHAREISVEVSSNRLEVIVEVPNHVENQ